MARLDAATENKLMQAVEKTASLVECEGLHPTKALEKVARDASLTRGAIEIVARAYNTGKSNAIRESGSDVFEKSASFESADSAAVISAIFPEGEIKTAAPKVDETAFSIDYFWAPESLLPKKAAASSCINFEDLFPAQATSIEKDPQLVQAGIAKRAAYLHRQVQYWQTEAANNAQEQIDAFYKLAAYFDADDCDPYESVLRGVRAFGSPSDVFIMEKVKPEAPTRLWHAKNANAAVPINRQHQVFELLEAVKTATAKCQYSQSTVTNIANGIAELIADGQPFRTDSVIPERTKVAAGINPISLLGINELMRIMNSTGDELGNHRQGAADFESAAGQKMLADIGTPDHEQNLRRIAVKSNLQKILSSDPILRGYSPHDVAQAFNQYAQISPTTIDRDLPTRMALRRQLSQDGLETFDQQQIADLDSSLRTGKTSK